MQDLQFAKVAGTRSSLFWVLRTILLGFRLGMQYLRSILIFWIQPYVVYRRFLIPRLVPLYIDLVIMVILIISKYLRLLCNVISVLLRANSCRSL